MKEKKKKVKEEKELTPIMENNTESNINPEELKLIAEQLGNNTITAPNDSDKSSDSFFRGVVDNLFDTTKSVSAKTEYLNTRENYVGSKLEYLSTMGNLPYLKEFINIFEIKRISLERKGRKEILLALEQRHQEMKTDQMKNFANMFNVV